MATVKDLKPNPKNPRTIADGKLDVLKRTLDEFGDLGCVVFNRRTQQLVGGHQRAKVIPPNTEIKITRRFERATKRGTVAEGYLLVNGERYKYREVDWDEIKEKAANIAANKGVGEWDLEGVSDWLREIDEFGFDLDLTLFDGDERADLMVPTVHPNFEEAGEGEQGKLDQKKPVECPDCGHSFVPKG